MKNEEGLSEFMKFAYKCNKVRDIDEVFEEYPVEEEWHQGKIGNSSYAIYIDTTTRVMWIKTIHTYLDGTGNGVGLDFEPLIDSEGKTLIYTGELTAIK